MTVGLRSVDLQPGDTLQHRDGELVRLYERERIGSGWRTVVTSGYRQHGMVYLPDAEIDRDGDDRLWWLDSRAAAPCDTCHGGTTGCGGQGPEKCPTCGGTGERT